MRALLLPFLLVLLFACGEDQGPAPFELSAPPLPCVCTAAGQPDVSCTPAWASLTDPYGPTACWRMSQTEPPGFIDYCTGWRGAYADPGAAAEACAATDPCIAYCACRCG